MRERGLPFQPSMVRAERAGIKTQTRRVVAFPRNYIAPRTGESQGTVMGACKWYAQPGERLWVREAWRTMNSLDDVPPRDIPRAEDGKRAMPILYEADLHPTKPGWLGKYRHARFMCRWMSRTLLEVTGVRAERLQAISEADALAEGIQPMRCPDCHLAAYGLPGWGHDELNPTARGAYRYLWESINGAGSWDLNPWVWAISFKRITP